MCFKIGEKGYDNIWKQHGSVGDSNLGALITWVEIERFCNICTLLDIIKYHMYIILSFC